MSELEPIIGYQVHNEFMLRVKILTSWKIESSQIEWQRRVVIKCIREHGTNNALRVRDTWTCPTKYSRVLLWWFRGEWVNVPYGEWCEYKYLRPWTMNAWVNGGDRGVGEISLYGSDPAIFSAWSSDLWVGAKNYGPVISPDQSVPWITFGRRGESPHGNSTPYGGAIETCDSKSAATGIWVVSQLVGSVQERCFPAQHLPSTSEESTPVIPVADRPTIFRPKSATYTAYWICGIQYDMFPRRQSWTLAPSDVEQRVRHCHAHQSP